jgi:hypothetical protein
VKLDKTAPIAPGVGLGGIELGIGLKSLEPLIISTESPDLTYRLVSRFEARFSFPRDSISICVDVRSGVIFKLIASVGYEGSFLQDIRPGISAATAFSLESRLFYFEPEAVILCRDVPGVCLDLEDDDPPPEIVPGLRILYISVHLPYPEFQLPPFQDYEVHRYPAGSN